MKVSKQYHLLLWSGKNEFLVYKIVSMKAACASFYKEIAKTGVPESLLSLYRLYFSLPLIVSALFQKNTSTKFMLVFKHPSHHIPNQTEIATEEFCPKSLFKKREKLIAIAQNKIDFTEDYVQSSCRSSSKFMIYNQVNCCVATYLQSLSSFIHKFSASGF